MFCNNCGAECADDAKFCNKCGATLTPAYSTENTYSAGDAYQSAPVYEAAPVKGGANQVMVIIAMALGIAAAFFSTMGLFSLNTGRGIAILFFVAVPHAVIGFIFNSNVKKANAEAGVADSGMTKAGLICTLASAGIFVLAVTILMFMGMYNCLEAIF